MKTKHVICIIVVAFAVVTAINVTKRLGYSDKHPIIDEIRRRITIIDPKFYNTPLRIGSESFTEDKYAITLCIIDPKTNRFYDINTLMYVTIHELSHTITRADGDDSHKDEFRGNFTRLLNEAAKKGVYDPRKPIPEDYCGGQH